MAVQVISFLEKEVVMVAMKMMNNNRFMRSNLFNGKKLFETTIEVRKKSKA